LLQQERVEVLSWSSSESFMTAASDTFKEIVAPPPVRAAKQKRRSLALRPDDARRLGETVRSRPDRRRLYYTIATYIHLLR
jgi:hypothetical protein